MLVGGLTLNLGLMRPSTGAGGGAVSTAGQPIGLLLILTKAA